MNKIGLCNCYMDKYYYKKKTNKYVLKTVRDTYSEVRIDKNGLCFLCANFAIIGKPPIRTKNNNDNKDALKRVDLTVSHENPDGVFYEREDESHTFDINEGRMIYDSDKRYRRNKNK